VQDPEFTLGVLHSALTGHYISVIEDGLSDGSKNRALPPRRSSKSVKPREERRICDVGFVEDSLNSRHLIGRYDEANHVLSLVAVREASEILRERFGRVGSNKKNAALKGQALIQPKRIDRPY